jgi:nitroimidazol reductase NimA-like FMN-containing flavoprotein (pyridoxamine 5'-phosphate oxidase superfamily)
MEPASARTTVKRNPRRGVYDLEQIRQILATHNICNVAYVDEEQPRQIATLYICDKTHMYFHGNRQAALLRHMAGGGEVCVNVMLIDGIVVARSGFHCSMNYRSVTVFGRGEEVTGDAHRIAVDRFVEALIPGHLAAVREPTAQELAATAVTRVALDEVSAKVRSGDPIDDESDLNANVWAGVIPMRLEAGAPIASSDLGSDIDLPDYIKNFHLK